MAKGGDRLAAEFPKKAWMSELDVQKECDEGTQQEVVGPWPSRNHFNRTGWNRGHQVKRQNQRAQPHIRREGPNLLAQVGALSQGVNGLSISVGESSKGSSLLKNPPKQLPSISPCEDLAQGNPEKEEQRGASNSKELAATTQGSSFIKQGELEEWCTTENSNSAEVAMDKETSSDFEDEEPSDWGDTSISSTVPLSRSGKRIGCWGSFIAGAGPRRLYRPLDG
ncbi:hypothetical protein F0562_028861 [Nyssa sinensis]|uniref:Uncharacterized protein n=1 Tax=Nyssa sinensis TaxID=561372 RepID=A0A5J5AZB7_9ASTE|nr:hypothetical protein F0562_028861 [Nyssa sinensis]